MEKSTKTERFSSCRGVAFEIKPHNDLFAIPPPSYGARKSWVLRITPSGELIQRSISKTSSHFCDIDLDEDDISYDLNVLLPDIEKGLEEENVAVESPLSLLPSTASKRERSPKPKQTNMDQLYIQITICLGGLAVALQALQLSTHDPLPAVFSYFFCVLLQLCINFCFVNAFSVNLTCHRHFPASVGYSAVFAGIIAFNGLIVYSVIICGTHNSVFTWLIIVILVSNFLYSAFMIVRGFFSNFLTCLSSMAAGTTTVLSRLVFNGCLQQPEDLQG